jgi:raffinose/stachyose/melibiose transport system substrate-binding protein
MDRAGRYIVTAISAAALLLAAGCGGSGSDDSGGAASGDTTTVLKVWDQFTDGGSRDASKKLYAEFEAAHPGIKIKAESYRFDDLAQLGKTALSSGTGPDVMYFDAGLAEAGELADAGLISPLDDYAAKYGWSDRISKPILDWSTYDGKLYGLGLEGEFNAMFANDSLIKKAGLTVPTTYQDLLAFCRGGKAKGFIPIAYGQGPAVYAKDVYAMVVNNTIGGDAVHSLVFDRQGVYDSPEMTGAISKWFKEMNDAGCFPPGVNGLTVDNAALLFHGKKALMLAGGTWQIGDIDDKMPDQKTEMLAFPEVDGGAGRFYPTGVGSAWIISSKSKSRDAAAQLLDFLFSPEAVKTWMTEGGIIPPVKTDLSALDLTPLIGQAAQLVQAGSDDKGSQLGYYIWPRWSSKLFNLFQDGSQAVTAGKMTAAEFAKKIQEQWTADAK